MYEFYSQTNVTPASAGGGPGGLVGSTE
jgi:hypothetical protein